MSSAFRDFGVRPKGRDRRPYTAGMRYAAFLRAINVGTTNRIRMETLRGIAVDAGFEDVSTYLQTGNVLFTSEAEPEAAALHFEEALLGNGLKNANAMLRTREDLGATIADCPFDDYDPAIYRQWLTFFRRPLPADARESFAKTPSVVRVRERELLTVTELARPAREDPSALISRKLGIPGTTRYWGVARDLLARMDP
jgi:uncharacterized protein (DUF1697 family)